MPRAVAPSLFALLACATPAPDRAQPYLPDPVTPSDRAGVAGTTFLVPNFQDADGTPAYVHFTREHMPIRVAVHTPMDAPRDGSPDDARESVRTRMQIGK